MASTSLAGVLPAQTKTVTKPKAEPIETNKKARLDEWFKRMLAKGQHHEHAESVLVTPEIANYLLDKNENNRKLREMKLEQLKSDMRHGRFKRNGESIVIAKDGKLNDGQHRLTAIAHTGLPQHIILVFGVERDSRFTVDMGAARSASDHMSLSGWPYAAQIATIARNVIAFERTKGDTLGRNGDISNAEVMERGTTDELIKEIAAYVQNYAAKLRAFGGPTIVGFCYYVMASKRPLQAKTFFEKLRTGVDLDENSPIRIAREYLISRPKSTKPQRVEILFRAWNSWINDKKLTKFQYMGNLPKLEG